jgi:HSP20 family protein
MAKGKDVSVQRTEERAPARFDREIERLFDDFFSRRWLRPFSFDWPSLPRLAEVELPKVDVLEQDDSVVVRAEMPGIDKDNIEVSVSDGSITLKGSARSEAEEKKEEGEYYRREISSRYLSRTVALPCEVDSEQAKAQLKDGVLEVTIPKSTRAKRRKIEIES